MPHVIPPAELQERATDYYRRKEYDKALPLLDKAIAGSTLPSAGLLDTRAACHAKLDDNASALKDAKQTIRLHERDVTGYLRAGRILQSMNKLELASGIYQHGIRKKVQKVELLQALDAKLQQKLVPPRAADPMSRLPLEMVEMIFGYMSFRQVV